MIDLETENSLDRELKVQFSRRRKTNYLNVEVRGGSEGWGSHSEGETSE
ncbi:MAG: hypothetical protein Q7S31_02385 [bacterium]|nr:hypothetical protein [bacterium]